MMYASKFELQITSRAHADAANYSSQVQFAIALASSCFVYTAAMERKIPVKCDEAKIFAVLEGTRCSASSSIDVLSETQVKESILTQTGLRVEYT